MSSRVGSSDHGDPLQQMEEMFGVCLRKHKALNPDSTIDIYLLNLSNRVSQERFPSARGHFADVYRGEMDNRTKVAIKMLRLPTYTVEDNRIFENTILHFFRELSFWNELHHLNIARMFGFALANGNIGFVSLWYQYGNLVQYLKFKPEASKADLMLDIAEGLDYLHTLVRPVIHADLKGLNVLINENGIACLGDFGISIHLGGLHREGNYSSGGVGTGTTPWMAPELFEEVVLFTRASDVYACAGVFLEVLCPGRTPYDYIRNEIKMIELKCIGEPPNRTEYPEIEEHSYLWELMAKCWSMEATARPDITEIIRYLYEQFELNPRVIKIVAHRPSRKVQQPPAQPDRPSTQIAGPTSAPSPVPQKELSIDKSEAALAEAEIRRHGVILELITATEQYLCEIGLIEGALLAVRTHKPPIIRLEDVESFVHVVFSDLLRFQGYQKKLLQALYARQRQQGAVIWRIGDVLLESAEDFAGTYPIYVAQGLPAAEKRLKAELSSNKRFQALLMEKYSKGDPLSGVDGERIVNLPSGYLTTFCKLVKDIITDTDPLHPDFEHTNTSLNLLQYAFSSGKLRSWQNAWLSEPHVSWKWKDLAFEGHANLPVAELERQQLILELIQREMSYANEFEDFMLKVNIDAVTSRSTDHTVQFNDVYLDQRTLVLRLHNMQLNERALIRSVMGTLLESGFGWSRLYKDYIIQRPHDWYDGNMRLRAIHDESGDISVTLVSFAIPRLQWYQSVFLPELERVTPQEHEDQELIKRLKDLLDELLSPLQPAAFQPKRRFEPSGYLLGLEETPLLNHLTNDAKLADEERVMVHSEHLWELDASNGAWHPVFLVLFDNCLVAFSEGYQKGKGWSLQGEITVVPTEHITLNNPQKDLQRVSLDIGTYDIFPFELGIKSGSSDPEYLVWGTTSIKGRSIWTDLLQTMVPKTSLQRGTTETDEVSAGSVHDGDSVRGGSLMDDENSIGGDPTSDDGSIYGGSLMPEEGSIHSEGSLHDGRSIQDGSSRHDGNSHDGNSMHDVSSELMHDEGSIHGGCLMSDEGSIYDGGSIHDGGSTRYQGSVHHESSGRPKRSWAKWFRIK